MDWSPRVIRAYVDHFLPRDVVGPVIIVFSLEGVIDGVFSEYVPPGYETLGWGFVFLLSLFVVAYWGAVDEEDLDDLHEQIDEIEAEETAAAAEAERSP
ncbi:hypothetical protein JCM30237_14080 [Halolamina litorea]|jgi:hypothetical protein|uniref:Uncharacterized protein n=1 Tax=Halolamina litorea TaxID=1515593 RepID=A0ABD6BNN3_9EURY|nr:hypothetical protein [Halolamina litorea]